MVERLGAELRRAWGPRWDVLGRLVAAGGGGKALWPELQGVHPAAVLAGEPVYGNAMGYVVLARLNGAR